jgi:hypothetical protein
MFAFGRRWLEEVPPPRDETYFRKSEIPDSAGLPSGRFDGGTSGLPEESCTRKSEISAFCSPVFRVDAGTCGLPGIQLLVRFRSIQKAFTTRFPPGIFIVAKLRSSNFPKWLGRSDHEWISQADAERLVGVSSQAIRIAIVYKRLCTMDGNGRPMVRRADVLALKIDLKRRLGQKL